MQYESQKGFCEDLDEGKFSFLLVHALQQTSGPGGDRLLWEILHRKREQNGGHLTREQKQLVRERLEQAGSFAYTRKALAGMLGRVEAEIKAVEEKTGLKNWILWLMLQKLTI